MSFTQGFQELFFRIGVDLFSVEGFFALGALALLVVIIYLVKKKRL